jgi:DedD protein
MDKQKTQRIIGILVIIAFVIVLIPLFFGKTDMSTEIANNKALPLPGQQSDTTTLATADTNEGQTPEDSAILNSSATSVNHPTDSRAAPGQSDDGQANTLNTTDVSTLNTDDSVISTTNNTDQGQADVKTEHPLPVNDTSNAQKNGQQTINGEDHDDSVINITSEVANQINSKTAPDKTVISSKPEVTAQSEAASQTNTPSEETSNKTTLTTQVQSSPSIDDQSSSLLQPKSDVHSAKKIVSEATAPLKVKKHKTITAEKKQSSKVKPVNLTNRELAKLNSTAWVVQMGNFKDKNNARRLADKLRGAGYKAFTKEIKSAKGNVSTRVYIGPEFKQALALQLSNKVEQDMKMHGIVVSIKPLEI